MGNGENFNQCKSISDLLVAEYEGRVFKCPECGEVLTDPEGLCECGDMEDMDEWEAVVLLEDTDIYDVEYRIGGDGEFRSVCLMVACGGPNIYIDTSTHNVELYWYNERAASWIPSEVCDEINELFEEEYRGGMR